MFDNPKVTPSVSMPQLRTGEITPNSTPVLQPKREQSSPLVQKANEVGVHTLANGSESPKLSLDRVISKGFEGRTLDDVAGRTLRKSTLTKTASQEQLKMEHKLLNRRINQRLQAASWAPVKDRIAALQTPGLKVTEDRRGKITDLTVKGSPCQVKERLGKGAQKEVFALDGGTADISDRHVLARVDIAELLMKSADLKGDLEGLVQEIETAAKLAQTIPDSNILVPNEIALVERESGYPCLYLLMERADGADLEKVMEDPDITETQPQLVYNLLIDCFEAVRDIHQQGVLHMDLREPNVLAKTSENGAQRGMVGDFGQAVSIEQFKSNPSCMKNLTQSALDPILASLYRVTKGMDDSTRDQLLEKLNKGDLKEAKALLPPGTEANVYSKLAMYRSLLQDPSKAEVWSAGLMLHRTVVSNDPCYYYHGFDVEGKLRTPDELFEVLIDFFPGMFEETFEDTSLSSYQNSPFSLMKRCISLDPDRRPTFDELINGLKEARDNQLSLGLPPDLDDPTLTPPTLTELQDAGAANKIRVAQAIEHWELCLDYYTNGLQDDDGNEVIVADQMMADQAAQEIQNLMGYLQTL